MKVLRLTLASAILLAGVTAAKAQTVDEIMKKHEQAIGGTENWNKIKTLKMTGVMVQQGMEINIAETVDIGKALRMDISAMGMNGWQIVTTNEGWMYMPFMGSAKVDTMKPEMVKASQRQLDVKGNQLLDYKAFGMKAEYEGKDTVNKMPCYKIKFTDKDGNESTSFFDMANYYLVRTDMKVKQNEEEGEVSVAYNNYKKMDEGVVLPTSVSAQGIEFTFKTIELNKTLDPDTFKPVIDKK